MDKTLARILECIGSKHGETKRLAEYLDIHPNAISNWRHGRTKSYVKYLPQIAEFYGVSVEYLKGEDIPVDTNEKKEKDKKIRDVACCIMAPKDRPIKIKQPEPIRVKEPSQENQIEYKNEAKENKSNSYLIKFDKDAEVVNIPLELLCIEDNDPLKDPLLKAIYIRRYLDKDDIDYLNKQILSITKDYFFEKI